MGSPHVSWDAALTLYFTVGKTILLKSLVHFQSSLIIFIYVFFIPVIFIFPFLPHLSLCWYLDKLESCATHSTDCFHWNILVWRRTHARIFFQCTLTRFHREQESDLQQAFNCASFSCDNSSLKPVSTYFKGPFDNEDVLCQGNPPWCTVRNKKVFNREELQCTDFTGRFKTSIFISTKYQASSMTTSCTSKLVNYFV